MDFMTSSDDQALQQQTESCDFPAADFNHRAHLRLAYVYLCEGDCDVATQRMKETLLGFLAHNGVDPAKFHETLTRAWVLAVNHFMNKSGGAGSADELIDRFPEMLDTQIMLTHYSAEVLFSEQARTAFLEPDIEAIPTD